MLDDPATWIGALTELEGISITGVTDNTVTVVVVDFLICLLEDFPVDFFIFSVDTLVLVFWYTDIFLVLCSVVL